MTGADHESHGHQHSDIYSKGSLSLTGSIAMGTGVMIGAGNPLGKQVSQLQTELLEVVHAHDVEVVIEQLIHKSPESYLEAA